MKRPEMVTLFAPSEQRLPETVRALLAALPDESREFTLGRNYARIEYVSQEGDYEFVDEQIGVIEGVDDLIARLDHDRGGMWCGFANLRFHATDIYVSHYYAEGDPKRLHTAVSTDPELTRFLETEAAGRGAYFAYLSRLADALCAAYFVSGVRLDGFRPLSAGSVLSRSGFEATFGTSPHPYVVGWREGVLDVVQVASGWEKNPREVVRTLSGYAILSRLPDPA